MKSHDVVTDLENKIKRVDTQSLDMSFNELLDMYNEGELDISPEYQRLFRWTEGAQSRFIESLLMQMPVPPIYVIETTDGKYELIDGLQRFSSYLHFRGKLKAPHFSSPIKEGDFLKLIECDIVETLNGATFADLPTILQIKLKRAFIRVEVVKKGNDNKFKYYMFKRLNTGGKALSEQQIRNCTIRLLNNEFIDFIIELSREKYFKDCVEKLSDTQKLESYDHELVLRFFALKNSHDKFVHDVRDFLTEYMEKVSDSSLPFDYLSEKECFNKTFCILSKAWGESVFGGLNKQENDLKSNFGIYHYESLVIGLQSIINNIDINNQEHIEKIKTSILNLKKDEEFKKRTTGGGKNSRGMLQKRIKISEKHFKEIIF